MIGIHHLLDNQLELVKAKEPWRRHGRQGESIGKNED